MNESAMMTTNPTPQTLQAGATETASTAVAAQARASVEARYVMALKCPRDWMKVRDGLLKACMRPGFAESAWYRKPVGKGFVEGFSIRFAEEALRCMTNMYPEVMTIYDDNSKRIIRVQLTDLESNLTYAQDVTIEKTVERSRVFPNQQVIGQRTNSQGNVTYIVQATEADFINKQGSAISKQLRNHAMRCLPGDIADDCRAGVFATFADKFKKDPAAETKKLADAFSALNIGPDALAKYLGHELATVTATELAELRGIYSGVKSGETNWHEALATKTGKESSAHEDTDNKPGNAIASAREKIQAAAGKAKKPVNDMGYSDEDQND